MSVSKIADVIIFEENTIIDEVQNTEKRQKQDQIIFSQDSFCNMNYSPERELNSQSQNNQNVQFYELGFVIDDDDEDDDIQMHSPPKTPQLFNSEDNKNQKNNLQKQDLKTDKNITTYSFESIQYLVERSQVYQVNKNEILSRNQSYTDKNRQILIDWLMDVSDKFHLKRETYQLAVNYLDRYIQSIRNLDVDAIQKLGITCLLLASKIEEIYCPNYKDFESTTDGGCSLEEILELETQILISLNWLVNPITLNSWANFYMQKWDQYLEKNPLELNIIDKELNRSQEDKTYMMLPKFKSDEHQYKLTCQSNHHFISDYLNFRLVMQTLDMALQDLDHYRYESRHLSISSVIIALALSFQILTLDQVKNAFEQQKSQLSITVDILDSIYDIILSDEENEFSHMIIHYIEFYCDVRISEIKETMKYILMFFTIPFQQLMPEKLQVEDQLPTQEEFFSYQIHYEGQEQILVDIQKLKSEIKFK